MIRDADELPLPDDDRWSDRAACKGLDPELFFTESLYAEAQKVCATCPVADECLADAMETREPFGVRGGKTPRQRGMKFEMKAMRDLCPRGHTYTAVTANGKRRCLVCSLPESCRNGHLYTAENTRYHTTQGHRVCLDCERERVARRVAS